MLVVGTTCICDAVCTTPVELTSVAEGTFLKIPVGGALQVAKDVTTPDTSADVCETFGKRTAACFVARGNEAMHLTAGILLIPDELTRVPAVMPGGGFGGTVMKACVINLDAIAAVGAPGVTDDVFIGFNAASTLTAGLAELAVAV